MNTHAHRRLIAHELGHALTGMLAGLRVECVWAPPPPEFDGVPPENPNEPAGFVLSRGGDRRARALMLLGGPLAEGKPAPSWPIEPHTDDERQLAKLVAETDELCYLELTRDAEEIITSDEFTTANMLAHELIATPPYKLDERQLNDIMRTKDIEGEGSEGRDEARELENRLIAEGIIPARAERYARVDPVILGTGENGNHASEEKAYEKAHPVRAEARAAMLALFDAADKQAPKPERKTAAPIQIATFEA
jgi:hypothetical protein